MLIISVMIIQMDNILPLPLFIPVGNQSWIAEIKHYNLFLLKQEKQEVRSFLSALTPIFKAQSFSNYFSAKSFLFLHQLAVQVLIAGALRSICVFVPFIAFQAYGYYNICLGGSVEETRPWCKARIPLLYNFIQSHYWYVGIFFAWSISSFSVFQCVFSRSHFIQKIMFF